MPNSKIKTVLLTEISRGVFEVRRDESEPAFARLMSPSASDGRNWGIYWPDASGEYGTNSSSHAKTKADAIYNLDKTVRVCSDYQLGLSDTI